MLAGDGTGAVPHDPERLGVIAIAGGRASGRLAGGCLSDLVHTIGTPWEPDLPGAVFFFEEVGRAPIQIDRALLHLEQAGKLEGVRGVVVGELAGSMATLPLGVDATVDADALSLTIDAPALLGP